MDNLDLNKSPAYKDEKCVNCGRKYPDTVLNIEGHILNSVKTVCINSKECTKYRNKKGKKK